MQQAIISQDESGNIAIKSPYNADFVAALKNEIEYSHRKWDGASKVWVVDSESADEAAKIASRFYEILDTQKMSAADVEGAQIDAEIAKIKANQQYILDNKEWIEGHISSLDGEISRYSYRSVSSVKHGKAMDRALLQHALNNAIIPVEKLTELQVRGLAAAARYVREA